jgi:hypothetical protein
MADWRRRFGRSPDEKPGVEEVVRTDRFVDALAAGRPADSDDPGDEALAGLLASWRDELRAPAADGLVTEADAAEALHEGSTRGRRVWRRAHRGLTMIGSTAAAVLTLGGFGAVVASSQPGDALYGLRTTLFGEPKSVVDDRVALTAKTEMEKVQQMIAQGQWDQAQQRMTSLGDTMQTVNNTRRRQDLVDQWNQLSAQVQNRDPNAGAPSGAPLASWPPENVPGEPATTSVTPSPAEPAAPGSTGPDAETGTEPATTTPAPWNPPEASTSVTPAPPSSALPAPGGDSLTTTVQQPETPDRPTAGPPGQ